MAGGVTRRGLIGGGAAGAAGVALGAGGATLLDGGSEERGSDTVAFTGRHQAGIATAAQDRLHFAAFEVTTRDRGAVLALLEAWTEGARRMTRGQAVGQPNDVALAPTADTGEAVGLPPARLTVTFGFGPGLFDKRFGWASQRPDGLSDLPELPNDVLAAERCGGDLCVQACADDPQVAFHAVRNLARIGRGTVTMRWSQLGFGRTASTSRAQQTPRNLFGFKDGTANLKAEDGRALDTHVWRPDGSTFLVARRIRMLIETWDRAPLEDQERTIGRTKVVGAPLDGTREFDPVRLRNLPPDSHVRLAHPDTNGGRAILRRGYSFTDGMDSFGQLDAGLFFIAFTRDPQVFAELGRRLGSDALNEYIKTDGSAVFWCPPGVGRRGFVGQALLA